MMIPAKDAPPDAMHVVRRRDGATQITATWQLDDISRYDEIVAVFGAANRAAALDWLIERARPGMRVEFS